MAAFPGHQQPCGVAAAGDTEAPTGFVEMAINRMLGDAQAASDLFRMEVIGDQTQTLALARRQPIYRLWIVSVPHKRGGKCPARVSSIPLVDFAPMAH